jgi:hypothetical protein
MSPLLWRVYRVAAIPDILPSQKLDRELTLDLARMGNELLDHGSEISPEERVDIVARWDGAHSGFPGG